MTHISLDKINIRTDWNSADLEMVITLHNQVYTTENNFGPVFETYVRQSLEEFVQNYKPENNRVWVAEFEGRTVGFIFLMNRGKAAQLRYFLIDPIARGIGLGKKLMSLFMEFLNKCKYESCYLWTVNELPTAAHLYKMYGFKLVEEMESTAFGKALMEQKYEMEVTRVCANRRML